MSRILVTVVLSRGMGLKILLFLCTRWCLTELVKGETAVGVRPALPIEGRHFILGNGLAGSGHIYICLYIYTHIYICVYIYIYI